MSVDWISFKEHLGKPVSDELYQELAILGVDKVLVFKNEETTDVPPIGQARIYLNDEDLIDDICFCPNPKIKVIEKLVPHSGLWYC